MFLNGRFVAPDIAFYFHSEEQRNLTARQLEEIGYIARTRIEQKILLRPFAVKDEPDRSVNRRVTFPLLFVVEAVKRK